MKYRKNKVILVLLFIVTFSVNLKSEIISKKPQLSLYLNVENALHFQATVSEFKDGDTVYVKRQDTGETEKIRFLGINTPEKRFYINGQWVYDPEPYSIEASEYTQNALEGKTFTVYYSADPNYQRDNTNSKRLIGVIVVDGRILNVDLLREGLAKRYFYNDNPIMKFKEWVKAEATARKRRLNIWSDYHKNRIVITEIYPDPPGNERDTGKEFIEIKNFGKKPVNLKDWLFMLDRNPYYLKFTSNDFILNPGEICVISTVPESNFRTLFPSMPQDAKYLQSENNFWFANNPTPPEQRIFYIATPDKLTEEVLTFSLNWYDGLRNGGKSLQRVNFREIETGITENDSPDKALFKADTPNPGVVN